MSTARFPRSSREKLGGLCHLGRLIDKIRMRNAGLIQDYNYLVQGLDKYLLEALEIDGKDIEKRVLAGGTDSEILEWVLENGNALNKDATFGWNKLVDTLGPANDEERKRFQGRLEDIAKNRGVDLDKLPEVQTWVDVIDLDENRI